MRNLLFYSFLSIYSGGIVAQDNSIKKLKDSQDVRKKYIDFETKESGIIKPPNKTTYVNPFIGTGGHGHTYPGASAPFGMMQLSPDTRFNGWDACGGYHYSDSIIYGFSHTHLSGTGVEDYCDLLIVPQSGKAKTTPGHKDINGYGSKFSHVTESASPGFYSVNLLDSKINVRLTTTEHSGMHEYTFLEKKGEKYILIDLDHKDALLNSSIDIINKSTISGSRISKSWAKEQHFYFHLETSTPFKKAKKITKKGHHKLLLVFPETTDKILLKVGISAVDVTGAKNNLTQEIPDWDFQNIRNETLNKWEKELNRIDFNTHDRDVMVKFYTSLYHSYLSPNIFNDVDRRYRGRDTKIHTLSKEEDNQYTVFSLWDTYRATNPLFTLTQPKRTSDFIKTFLRQYDEGGDLPVWELAANETECMIGYHSASVISDAYTKGITDFDLEKALKAMLSTSTNNEYGKTHFYKNGFISLNDEPESVSKTLEYSYDDFCISRFAKLKGNTLVEKQYLNRSMNFINLFDPSSKFMRGRRNGLWFSPFNPAEVNFNYTEANSWQYSLYAPHAVGVLSDLIGGKDSLSSWLDHLFTTKSILSGRDQVDITGLIGQYAHGNEPSHHIAYLYNYTNQPYKTQLYTDKIMSELYTTKPDGLSGNEDCGQMSSWYVLSAMGLYQIAPGNPYYDFGRPLAIESIIEISEGVRFRIKNLKNSSENKYIQKITLNGTEINRLYISHEEILKGGVLEFEMGNTPNEKVNSFEHAPTISTVPTDFIPVPYFETESRIFKDSTSISVNYTHLKNRKFQIKYTLDSTEPTISSPSYSKPIHLNSTGTLKIALLDIESTQLGKSTGNEFVKNDTSISLILNSTYKPQYSAGGKNVLIDGLKGGNDYRTGDWQGYLGQDLLTEISFSTPRKINEISLGCIEDKNAWIFFPQSVSYEISTDGINFKKLKEVVRSENSIQNTENIFYYTTQTNTNEQVKKIRVTAKSFGNCPKGHPGEGNPTWIFSDEILFR